VYHQGTKQFGVFMATQTKNSALKVVAPLTSLRTTIIMGIIAALLFIVANSAFWFNKYIFNTQNFTNLTTEAVLSDSSRQAMATVIVEKALQNRPRLESAIEQPATKLISGLLDSDLSHTVLTKTVTRLQTIMTSANPQPVVINFEPLKDASQKILNVASAVSGGQVGNGEKTDVSISDLPDQVVLVNPEKLPNIYLLGSILLWVGPLAVIGTLILLAYPLIRNRTNLPALQSTFAVQGVILFFGWLLALVIGPLFKPPVLGQVPDPNLRVLVDNVYSAFIGKFDSQSIVILIVAIVWLLVAGGIWYYRFRPGYEQIKAAVTRH
jgi:hypothetical protein